MHEQHYIYVNPTDYTSFTLPGIYPFETYINLKMSVILPLNYSLFPPSFWKLVLCTKAHNYWATERDGKDDKIHMIFVQDESLQWRHNGCDSVSNHHPHDCLLNRLFRRRSMKHQSSAWRAFVRGIHRWPVNSPHKWPVTRKMFPFDDVIMFCGDIIYCNSPLFW